MCCNPKCIFKFPNKFEENQPKMLRKPTATTASIDMGSHTQFKQQLTKTASLNAKTMYSTKKKMIQQ